MVVAVPETEVRSGGSEAYYITGKLRRGDRVEVVPAGKNFPGWVAIKPPPGSFSWVNARFVKRRGQYLGDVIAPADTPVPVKPGSSETDQEPNVEIAKVERGTIVTVLDEPKYTSTDAWLPIAPTPREVRYVRADALKRPDTMPAMPPQSPAGPGSGREGSLAAPSSTQALAVQAMQHVEAARRLLEEAIDRTVDPAQKTQYLTWLKGLPATPAGLAADRTFVQGAAGLPGQTVSLTGASSGPATAMFNSSVNPKVFERSDAPPQEQSRGPGPVKETAGRPQWSGWGVLRKSAIQKDGRQMYVLVDGDGRPLVYAAAEPGKSLERYVGSTVCLYGPIAYRSDEFMRTYFMTASHVALADGRGSP
jgi:hypothetical protein